MNPPVSGMPAWASMKKHEQAAEHGPAEREAAVAVDRVVVVAARRDHADDRERADDHERVHEEVEERRFAPSRGARPRAPIST